jgi:Ca-activated chloride channel family protein
MKRFGIITLILAFTACTLAPPPSPSVQRSVLPGQAAVYGQVVDNSGAPLPGVTVTATDAHGGQRSVVTDANGNYTIAGIAAGRYTLRAELPGLQTATQRADIPNGRLGTSPLVMSVASVSQTITVTAEAPMVRTNASATSTTYSTDSLTAISHAPPARYVSVEAVKVEPRPQYAEFEDHGFIDTAKENVTTFAIDVDRASYANIRRIMSFGQLPPRDAVRIEEMVNYFTYDLPQPTGTDPFSITTEVSGCPWNPAARLLRIGIQGRNLEQWKMAPNNLVFLIDVSGSMSGANRLPLVLQAFHVLVDQLRAEDRVAIVVYAGTEGLALPSTSGADKRTILAALDNLQAGGSTAGAAGIELAYKIAKQNFIQGGNNRVILATDGDFNVGVSSIPALQEMIEKKRESGIFLSTIGVGEGNYQDALMETLADKGNGNYAYLDTLKEAEKVFKTELTGTLVTIAKDVKVQLEFDPVLVQSYRQIGYENRALANKDFDDDTKDAGELGAGHSVTALYEIVPKAMGTIAKINLRYKEPTGDVSKLVTASAVDQGKSVFDASPDMQFAAAVAELGMLLRNSPHKGSASWDDVAHLARLSRGADLDGLRGEFATMVESATLQVKVPEGVARKD